MAPQASVFLALLLAVFQNLKVEASSENSLKFETVHTSALSWPKFFKGYIKHRLPIILRNGCSDNKAFRLWSPDYIYFHPGAALTFRNLTTKTSSSIRKMVEQRDQFTKMQSRLPEFLSEDIKIPDCLDCSKLTSAINTPFLLWHFQDTQIHLHEEKAHELWCLIRGVVGVTLIPEWTPGMIDEYATDQRLSDDPLFKSVQFYRDSIKEGDCVYIPAEFLRQWKPAKGTMVIIYQIPNSILLKHEHELETCAKAEPTDWVEFADDGQEEGNVKHNHELKRFISYLGKTDCIDFSLFWDSMINDPGLVWLDRKATREALAKEIFDALDKNHDGQFCWADVDTLTLETATQLSEFLKKKQIILEEGLGEFNRKTYKKARDLNLEWNDQRFLDTVWEGLVEQYGDKVGNIFDGPWVEEQREEARRKKHSHAEL